MKRSDVSDFLKQHGYDPRNVHAVTFATDAYVVEECVLDSEGRKQLDPLTKDDVWLQRTVKKYDKEQS